MKYITLIYEQADAIDRMSKSQHDVLIEQHLHMQDIAKQEGVYVAASELKPPRLAKTVTTHEGGMTVNDGPFSEAKEWFVGFYLFDCENLDQAMRFANMIPTAPGGGIEIRPLDEASCNQSDGAPEYEYSLEGKSLFALLNYIPEQLFDGYSSEEMQTLVESNMAMSKVAAGNKDYLSGHKLMSAATTTTLKGDNDKREIIDGPFSEAKEVLLGLHLVACGSHDAALTYAKALPETTVGSVEVRPINFFERHSDTAMQWTSSD